MLIEDPKITNNVAILELKGLKPVENTLNYDASKWPRLTTVWIGRTSYDCNQGQCYIHQEFTTTRYEDDNDDAIILTDVGITLISCICAALCGGVFYASRQYIMRACACCRRQLRGGITLGGISFGENSTNTTNDLIELSSANPPNVPCESSTNAASNSTNSNSNVLLNPPADSSTPICHPIPVSPPKAPRKPPKPSFITDEDSTFSLITPSNNRNSSKNMTITPKPWPRTSTLSTSEMLGGLRPTRPTRPYSSRQDSGFGSFGTSTRSGRMSHFDDIEENETFYH
jgi:hypothetical protein